MSISYTKSDGPLTLVGYADSDFASDPITRKSVSGYLFTINGNPVSWSSRKQSCVATSTAEAEYIAASHAAKEAIWLRRILKSLGHPQEKATIIFEDNMACISMSKDPVFHRRTKHIDVHYHYVREKCLDFDILLEYISTASQPADMMTKALDKQRHFRCLELARLTFQ